MRTGATQCLRDREVGGLRKNTPGTRIDVKITSVSYFFYDRQVADVDCPQTQKSALENLQRNGCTMRF